MTSLFSAYVINAVDDFTDTISDTAKTKTAIVPAPSKISCKMSNGSTLVSWSKVNGVSGYIVYRSSIVAKTLKSSATSWKDTNAYDSRI